MTEVKKTKTVVLVFQRSGIADEVTHTYNDVHRTQVHLNDFSLKQITIHRADGVHVHSETGEFRLVRMSKYFA